MLITLIVLFVFVVSWTLIIISRNKLWYGENDKKWYGVACVSILTAIASSTALIICCLEIGTTHINVENKRIALEQTREYYERIIDSDTVIYVNDSFYEDVIEFNKTINDYKVWGNNIWTSWFWNDELYGGIEPIGIGETNAGNID